MRGRRCGLIALRATFPAAEARELDERGLDTNRSPLLSEIGPIAQFQQPADR